MNRRTGNNGDESGWYVVIPWKKPESGGRIKIPEEYMYWRSAEIRDDIGIFRRGTGFGERFRYLINAFMFRVIDVALDEGVEFFITMFLLSIEVTVLYFIVCMVTQLYIWNNKGVYVSFVSIYRYVFLGALFYVMVARFLKRGYYSPLKAYFSVISKHAVSVLEENLGDGVQGKKRGFLGRPIGYSLTEALLDRVIVWDTDRGEGLSVVSHLKTFSLVLTPFILITLSWLVLLYGFSYAPSVTDILTGLKKISSFFQNLATSNRGLPEARLDKVFYGISTGVSDTLNKLATGDPLFFSSLTALILVPLFLLWFLELMIYLGLRSLTLHILNRETPGLFLNVSTIGVSLPLITYYLINSLEKREKGILYEAVSSYIAYCSERNERSGGTAEDPRKCRETFMDIFMRILNDIWILYFTDPKMFFKQEGNEGIKPTKKLETLYLFGLAEVLRVAIRSPDYRYLIPLF